MVKFIEIDPFEEEIVATEYLNTLRSRKETFTVCLHKNQRKGEGEWWDVPSISLRLQTLREVQDVIDFACPLAGNWFFTKDDTPFELDSRTLLTHYFVESGEDSMVFHSFKHEKQSMYTIRIEGKK